jgi:hypothetical protein
MAGIRDCFARQDVSAGLRSVVPVCDRLEVRAPDGGGLRGEEQGYSCRRPSTSAPVVAQPPMVSAPRSRRPAENPTTRVYAHATGESRQAMLDELAALLPSLRSWTPNCGDESV